MRPHPIPASTWMTCRLAGHSARLVRPRERMRALKRCAAALLCASSLAYAGAASAQTAPIELKWNAIDGCPNADTVLARVRKIAGATRPTPHTLRADATVTQPSDNLFRLRLE